MGEKFIMVLMGNCKIYKRIISGLTMVEIKDNIMKINIKKETDETYEIVFGNKLFPQIARDLKEFSLGSRYAIITDSNLELLYAEILKKELIDIGLKVEIFSFEAGEKNKTMETCMSIIREMSILNYGRDSAILALGGGIVGDMAGFIASMFNRGVPFIQIPTTILAQADSSIGGKTAVNTKFGKNLIGSFKQPKKVYIDISILKTLSEKEVRTGLAETIKHGIIQDADFLNYLQENIEQIFDKSEEALSYISKTNCKIKGNIIEIDPFEKGLRKIVNYGHTVGHAIEILGDFKLSHGEAISIGMMVAGRISNILGDFSKEDLEIHENLLIQAGLPIKIPLEISNQSIIEVTFRDKKAENKRAKYVLPISLGKMNPFDGSYATYVEEDVIIQALEQTR